MTVKLPPDPKDKLYEDFVAAWLSALGYFIEARVERRNVLELDVVATDWSDPPQRMLVEAKSGAWGFADVFKVYGWRAYLNIPRGYVVCSAEADAAKRKRLNDDVSPATSVRALYVSPRSDVLWTSGIEPMTEVDEDVRYGFLNAAWYQRIASRIAQVQFIQSCKANPGSELHQKARTYHNAVEASFFAKTAAERVQLLYDAFQASPKLSGAFADVIAAKKPNVDVFRQLENEPDRLAVQGAGQAHACAR